MPEKNNNHIALLTDFGLTDPYTGLMKAVVKSINPAADIIDITHNIQAHNVVQAAFILAKSYGYFPKGTIFISVVDPGVGGCRKPIALKTEEHIFIAPDNGLLTFVAEMESNLSSNQEKPFETREISNPDCMLKKVSRTFHGRDIFAPTAAWLSIGMNFSEIGNVVSNIQKLNFPPVVFDNYSVKGSILYADHFGNLITNIEKTIIDEHISKTGKQISRIRIGTCTLDRLNDSYEESQKGEPLAIIGSFDTLEISVNCGRADNILPGWREATTEVLFA